MVQRAGERGFFPLATIARMFTALSDKPDHPALELEILDVWEREKTFEPLRERNRGGPTWSFVDGPVTANKTLGVHTAWGRTLKDVFQRYKALRGFDQRYQNGFDCQGLWIEVGVERELGLNSKREIEEYGLENFARKCRDVVVWSSQELTRGSKRLGQWMDWGNDYFTFSDTNIEYIWKFLKIVNERGWLYMGHRSTEWCPRCGTSLSQHELSQSGVYQERADPSLYVRFPLLDRQGAVARRLDDDAVDAARERRRRRASRRGVRPAGERRVGARSSSSPTTRSSSACAARSSSAGATAGRSTTSRRAPPVEHRVIPWDDVTIDQGTGVVHIAPGCGGEDFELSKVHDLPCSRRSTSPAASTTTTAGCTASRRPSPPDQIIGDLGEQGLLVESGLYTHAYPHCWRCDTPLIFRLSDDWFISVEEIRPKLLEENAKVAVGARVHGQAHGRLAAQHGRLEHLAPPLLRTAAAVLPVLVRAPERHRVEGRSSRERATEGFEQLEELRRPWVDRVPIRCEQCGEPVDAHPRGRRRLARRRHRPVLDARLGEPASGSRRATRRAPRAGLTTADLPDHAYWEKWFPADWVSEMREQIRLWFYSQFFMSVVARRPLAVQARARLREDARRARPRDARLVGQHDRGGGRVRADGRRRDALAVLRAAAGPQPALRLRPRARDQAQAADVLELGQVPRRLRRTSRASRRRGIASSSPTVDLRPLDRWLVARTKQLVAEATEAYEATLTVDVIRAFEAFVDDVSNWYIRRSRRRFYSFDEAAFRTLWYALVQSLRVVSPVMPFLTDHLWRNLVPDGPASVHLAPWPEPGEPDARAARRDRGGPPRRRARPAGALERRSSSCASRCAGSSSRARRARTATPTRSRRSCASRTSSSARSRRRELRVKPNLPVLGPKLGAALRDVRAALAARRVRGARRRTLPVDGHELEPDEVLVERVGLEGWAVASRGRASPSRSTPRSTTSCGSRAGCSTCIHEVNALRKESGLELTDRIRLWVPGRASCSSATASGSPARRSPSRSRSASSRTADREGVDGSLAAVALLAGCRRVAGCGGSGSSAPKDDPGAFASKVVSLIMHNRVRAGRGATCISMDQASRRSREYVGCETRSPVIAVPRGVKVLKRDRRVGRASATARSSTRKAVAVRLAFAGAFKVTHTVHLVAEDGRWKWILPSCPLPRLQGEPLPGRPGLERAAVDS